MEGATSPPSTPRNRRPPALFRPPSTSSPFHFRSSSLGSSPGVSEENVAVRRGLLLDLDRAVSERESWESSAIAQPPRSSSASDSIGEASTNSRILGTSSTNSLSTLRLWPPSPSGSSSSSSSTSTRYSDRFIPSRSASNFMNFALLEKSPKAAASNGVNSSPASNVPTFPANQSAASATPASADSRETGDGAAYSQLLRSELFGQQTVDSTSTMGGTDGVMASSTSVLPTTPDKLNSNSSHLLRGWGSPASPTGNMFRFKSDERSLAKSSPSSLRDSPFSLSPVGVDAALSGAHGHVRCPPRRIAQSPFKVLDAPALQDDFYLNLVDWSCDNNLAVGLGNCVYVWNASSGKVSKLCDIGPTEGICSLVWSTRGSMLSVGTSAGEVQVWDVRKGQRVRSMAGHRSRVGALAWSSHGLASGGRDRCILLRDVRAEEDFVARLLAHKSEVCGLKWSYDERELASGGNDNQLLVWSAAMHHSLQPLMRFQPHQAAVKAIAWSPHQHGLLASGGGTADRCIRFWSTSGSAPLACVDTGSQVCNLAWSKNANELVSTHGYSQNQVIVWRYPSLTKLATLTGHSMRVLYLAVSPDGQTIVTGAGDETLRFWNVFPKPKPSAAVAMDLMGPGGLGRAEIR